jgi:hypothetical protein
MEELISVCHFHASIAIFRGMRRRVRRRAVHCGAAISRSDAQRES